MEADFDQWDVVAPPRQAPRPSAPSRSSAQVQRPSVAAPVEDPVVAEPPRGQSDNQFSQQQDTLADVDYRDEFPTSEPTIDQFADYELFEDRKLMNENYKSVGRNVMMYLIEQQMPVRKRSFSNHLSSKHHLQPQQPHRLLPRPQRLPQRRNLLHEEPTEANQQLIEEHLVSVHPNHPTMKVLPLHLPGNLFNYTNYFRDLN